MQKVVFAMMFTLTMIPVTLYPTFFVNRAIMPALVRLIRNESVAIDFAMYTFTYPVITEELQKAAERGVRVNCVLDNFSQQAHKSQTKELVSNLTMDIMQYNPEKCEIMHDKFWIFSQNWSMPVRIVTAGIVYEIQKGDTVQPLLFAGSCNTTCRAADENMEHMSLRSDPNEIEAVRQYFNMLQAKSFKLSNYEKK
jgi:phosphatidylserine/phosphatidylglycerophosphate/cardiolipin synthase-like enzyme